MKIYIAAPWVKKNYAKEVSDRLKDLGLTIVSRWHDNEYAENEQPDEVMRRESQMDFEDVKKADTLIYFNLAKSEGKASELGMALIKDIPIYAVGGKDNNVFLHLPQIKHYASLEEVICQLT